MNKHVNVSDITLEALRFDLERVAAGDTVTYPSTANPEFRRRLEEALALRGLAGKCPLVKREPGRRSL